MAMDLFNPFEDMIFDSNFCFLSGKLTTDHITVFPEWLMEHFKLTEETLTLMENSQIKKVPYPALKLPCAGHVKKAFDDLDQQFREAYKNGYEGMAQLDEQLLFLWSGRIVYGLFYLEMLGEWERHQKIGKEFTIAPKLKNRMRSFHLMLQSIVEPISFVGEKPWSIVVFPLKYSADILSYRDDVINLMFQFGVNGFGFIACLQDNGAIAEEQHEIVGKMKGHTLHPIQFEELYARFHYTADLLQYQPRYKISEKEGKMEIEALPLVQTNPNLPLFGFWIDDFYARLLSNYWQVYGIEKGEIIQFQKPFLSFLEHPQTRDFVDPETINLPF